MNKLTQAAAWMLVSDVDDTLLGDDGALADFAAAMGAQRTRFVLVYNSSRPCASLRKSLAAQPALPQPDYLIGALGTEIELGRSGQALDGYSRMLATGWRRDEIAALMAELGLAAHAAEYQTPLKASYDAPARELRELALTRLAGHDIRVKVIFSGDKNLDLIPVNAGKGQAADYLRARLDFRPERVLVAGDSGNDREMFRAPFKGIVVGNADADLKALTGPHIYHARASHAAGVLEGLRFWGAL